MQTNNSDFEQDFEEDQIEKFESPVISKEKEEEQENSIEGEINEDMLNEEEIKKLNEERTIKQDFLRSEIIKEGYEPAVFSDYISELKEDGDNIDLWTIEQLKIIVSNFRDKYEPPKKIDYNNPDNDLFADFDENELDNFFIFKKREAVFKEKKLEVIGKEIEEGDLIGDFVVFEDNKEELKVKEEIEPEDTNVVEIKTEEKIEESYLKKIEESALKEEEKSDKDPFGGVKPIIRITKYIKFY